MSVPWAGDREIGKIAARFFLVELREMMCEKKREVKQGLQPKPENEGEREILAEHGEQPRESHTCMNLM
jgi:hypothetical protein